MAKRCFISIMLLVILFCLFALRDTRSLMVFGPYGGAILVTLIVSIVNIECFLCPFYDDFGVSEDVFYLSASLLED